GGGRSGADARHRRAGREDTQPHLSWVSRGWWMASPRVRPCGGGLRSAWSASDLPGAVAEDGHSLAVTGQARDGYVIAADPEVDVNGAAVDPPAQLFRHCRVDPVAEGDVADGILVQESVVEDAAEAADAAGAIDQGGLAEPARALVEGGAAAHHV